jgi:hypothetical protein
MRFTIQDAIWLMVLVGVGIFSWADHSILSNQIRNFRIARDNDQAIIATLDRKPPSSRE